MIDIWDMKKWTRINISATFGSNRKTGKKKQKLATSYSTHREKESEKTLRRIEMVMNWRTGLEQVVFRGLWEECLPYSAGPRTALSEKGVNALSSQLSQRPACTALSSGVNAQLSATSLNAQLPAASLNAHPPTQQPVPPLWPAYTNQILYKLWSIYLKL